MAADGLVVKISSNGTNWVDLPTPLAIKPSYNVIDSSDSGRDNNSGAMIRTIVTQKLKYEITLDAGISETKMSQILAVLMGPYFYITVPNIYTGAYNSTSSTKKFYSSSAEPEIEIIDKGSLSSTPTWRYKEWTFSAIEM